MKLKKWNYQKHEYEDYEVPDTWKCSEYSEIEDKVNCPHCGKELKYGDCYTSMEIHTEHGFGYGVCEKCYAKEWERRERWHKRNEGIHHAY